MSFEPEPEPARTFSPPSAFRVSGGRRPSGNVELVENINVVTKEDLGEEIVFPSSEEVNQNKRMRM